MGSLQAHAFGPLVAIGLVAWSLLAIRQRRVLPRRLWAWPLPRHHPALVATLMLALLGYWAGRLALRLI